MLISIRDSTLSCVANMDNTLPKALHYYDDNWRRLLKEATSTFSFTVDKTGLEAEQYLTERNYLSFVHENRSYLFNIMRVVESSEKQNITVYAENLNLELLNDTKQGIDVTSSQNILWYLNNDNIINGAGLTVGINEVSDQVRKIKIESEQTALARLLSIATNFDAEIEFITELNSDGTIKSLILNIYKKYDGVSKGVGAYRNDVTLYYSKNVDGITRTTDKTDLYNAITPVGKDGVSIKDLERTVLDSDGNVKYFTKKDSYAIYAPQSMAIYPSKVIGTYNGYIHKFHSIEGISDINTLFSLSVNELEKHVLPAISYEVVGYYNLNIGDTVKIQDDSFNPMLIIQARVAEQSISFSDPSKNKTIFSNILALESKISQDLTGRLKELVDQATPYRFEIVSDNGLTFKNSTGSTTLTARVYKGSNIDEVSVDSFEWLLDGVSFGGITKSQLVDASQVTGTSVVRYNAKIGDTVIGGVEVTLQDISDGISPTVTINPDTSLTIVDAKGTSTTPVLKGSDGTDGTSGIIVSSVAPASPHTGQLWQDTSTTPQLVKKWTGTSWVIWELYAQNLKADTLSAISANLGDVSAGTVKLTDDVAVGDTLKKYGIYQSKLGLLSSGPSLSAPGTFSDSKMGVANLNKGELRFMVTDYTEDLKTVQESGISDPNAAFIQFNSYDDGRDELTISSSGSIFMSGQVSQTEQWQTIAPGVVCKRSFGMISLWYSVTPTVSGDFQMGTIPADMRPQFALMFYAPVFQSTTTNDRKIQVNAGGSVILLNAVATGNYRGNLSFTV